MTSELSDVEALLEKVLPNPVGFVERVVEQALDRLATDVPGGQQSPPVSTYESTVHEALVDQNVLLAAALGACDCWGHDPSCPVCSGKGSAGWTAPDRDLYEEYVQPAYLRMATDTTSKDSTQENTHPMEGPPE